MLLVVALAAFIAGIGWLVRDLPGVVSAPRTGTIRSKAYGSPLIRREDDPERFERLVSYRGKRLIWGWLLAIGGGLFVVPWVLSIVFSIITGIR